VILHSTFLSQKDIDKDFCFDNVDSMGNLKKKNIPTLFINYRIIKVNIIFINTK
jgi:hypothetical protein